MWLFWSTSESGLATRIATTWDGGDRVRLLGGKCLTWDCLRMLQTTANSVLPFEEYMVAFIIVVSLIFRLDYADLPQHLTVSRLMPVEHGEMTVS